MKMQPCGRRPFEPLATSASTIGASSTRFAASTTLDPDVRGMAARALGRSGRQAAVPYLSAHLEDEWLVAAHCATGLRRIGGAGSGGARDSGGLDGSGRRSRASDAVGAHVPEGWAVIVFEGHSCRCYVIIFEGSILVYFLDAQLAVSGVRGHGVRRAQAASPALDRARSRRDRPLARHPADLADRSGVQRRGDHRPEPSGAAAVELSRVRSGGGQRRLDRWDAAGRHQCLRPRARGRSPRAYSRNTGDPRRCIAR